jgi:hypothetical protein
MAHLESRKPEAGHKKTAVPKDGGRRLQLRSKESFRYWQVSTLKLSMRKPFGADAAVFESVVMR